MLDEGTFESRISIKRGRSTQISEERGAKEEEEEEEEDGDGDREWRAHISRAPKFTVGLFVCPFQSS